MRLRMATRSGPALPGATDRPCRRAAMTRGPCVGGRNPILDPGAAGHRGPAIPDGKGEIGGGATHCVERKSAIGCCQPRTNIPAILIVENEALIRLLGVGTFADAGFRVIEANSGDLSRASRGSDSNSGNNGPAVPDRR
jgi:hypothetical protein